MQNLAERIKKRYNALKSDTERGQWESHCEDVARVISPRKRGFISARTPGEKKMQYVHDSTGIHANDLLTASLHGEATNPAAQWFKIGMSDEHITRAPNVKKYLSDVEDIMWAHMYSPGTQITTAFHELYHDLGAFGSAIVYIRWDEEGEHLVFNVWPLSECVFAESNKGIIDTIFRSFTWTVRQVVQEWGIEAVSDKVLEKYNNDKLEERIEIIHGMYPRPDEEIDKKQAGELSPENMPFASVYMEADAKHILENGGYPEQPFAVPRWDKRAGEVYGRSPGMTALPDVNMLQAMNLSMIKVSQKFADPPTFIPDDADLDPARLIPGGINRYRGDRSIFQLPPSQGLPLTLEIMESLRNRIRSAFFIDQMQFVNDAQMTATEVMQRTQERMRRMGPIMGRLESELLAPMIARCYGILERMGKLPPRPEELENRDYTVEYTSPIAMAQKTTELDSIPRLFEIVQMYAQDPQSLAQAVQLLPARKVLQFAIDKLNVDPDMVASEDDLAAADQQAQQQQMMAMAGPARDGAAALKDVSSAIQQGGATDGENLGANIQQGAEGIQGMMDGVDPEMLKQLQGMMNGQ
ncbi:MAG: hypothetical protein GY942_18625 [Aestuariibacter sp.]|nr:hypothetical protein [Aestuariibacter sp.]